VERKSEGTGEAEKQIGEGKRSDQLSSTRLRKERKGGEKEKGRLTSLSKNSSNVIT